MQVEQGVEVGQQCVASSQCASYHLGNIFPKYRWILLNGAEGVVVPRKRIEGAKLVPPGAQFRLSVADEATDIRPDHGNPKLVELQHPDDRPPQVLPVGEVVSKPVCCPPVEDKLL